MNLKFVGIFLVCFFSLQQLVAQSLPLDLVKDLVVSVPESPYSLVVVYPDEAMLKPGFHKELKKVQDEVIDLLPGLMLEMSLSLKSKDSAKVALVKLSEILKEKLNKKLKKVQKNLSEDFINFNIYFFPLNNDVRSFGQSADVKVDTFEVVQFRYNSKKSKESIYQLFASLRESVAEAITLQSTKKVSKYLPVGGAFNIQMDKRQALVGVQTLGVIQAGTTPFEQVNDQVKISNLVVNKNNNRNATVALVSIQNILTENERLPEINIQLGQYEGINGSSLQLQVNAGNKDLCADTTSLPYLSGVTNEKLAGIKQVDSLLKDKPIKFFFRSLDIDSATLQVNRISMRTQIQGLPATSCLDLSQVDTQFKGEINSTINNLFKGVEVDEPLKDKLIDELFK